MNRRNMLSMSLKGMAALGLFTMVGSLAACGAGQITRVIAALRALPAFITAFGLASSIQTRILNGITQITVAAQIPSGAPVMRCAFKFYAITFGA
jgi:phosphoribosylcarboxyaminoimidazole (NCAIR) mutase